MYLYLLLIRTFLLSDKRKSTYTSLYKKSHLRLELLEAGAVPAGHPPSLPPGHTGLLAIISTGQEAGTWGQPVSPEPPSPVPSQAAPSSLHPELSPQLSRAC